MPITRMTSDAVVEFLGLMEASSIEVCLDGGWGIDALLGEQTREHADLDIILRVEDVPRLLAATRAAEEDLATTQKLQAAGSAIGIGRWSM